MNGAVWHREGPKETPWPRANEPSKATPLGNAQREPLGIFLGNTAIDRVEEAIATDPEASITGLLIGYPFTGPYRPFILVTEALIVDFPINEDGEPEFSSHGFADAYPAFAELGSDVSVVGWFSAQPRKAPEYPLTSVTPTENTSRRSGSWRLSSTRSKGRRAFTAGTRTASSRAISTIFGIAPPNPSKASCFKKPRLRRR